MTVTAAGCGGRRTGDAQLPGVGAGGHSRRDDAVRPGADCQCHAAEWLTCPGSVAKAVVAADQHLRAAVHARSARIRHLHRAADVMVSTRLSRGCDVGATALCRCSADTDVMTGVSVRILGIELEVAVTRERRDRQDRRVRVGRLSRREVERVAELRVMLVEVRIRDPDARVAPDPASSASSGRPAAMLGDTPDGIGALMR